MSKRQSIWILGMLALAVTGAWAQDSSTPPPEPASPGQQEPQATPQAPIPAYGQENTPPPISENPPLSGLDLPSLEPHAAPLSYIQPGATFSESADSNVGNNLGSGSFSSISRGLGSVTLKRLWSNYDLAADYIGGVGYYDVAGQGFKAMQQADVDQKITWKRGQLSVRDSFSYLPEGNFGGAYGSTGSQGIESLGNTAFSSFWGGNALGTIGLASRILNVSLADVSENLTPNSSITAAGGYAITHFYQNSPDGIPYLDSSQVSAQTGYNRILTSHTQIALVYGYQGFDFNTIGTAFHSHLILAMYGHRITGRMDLLIGAGPQFTRINTACTLVDALSGNPLCGVNQSGLPTGSIPENKTGVAAQARLRYKFTRTYVDLSYQRFETSGSGLFAGAQSDIARLSANRPLSRVWNAFTDIGYARNSRLQSLSLAQTATCVFLGQPNPIGLPICPVVDANTYSTVFAGGGVHRAIGRNFHAFASYQFNELWLDHSYCGGLPACSRISNREVVTIGLDWTPRPIRID